MSGLWGDDRSVFGLRSSNGGGDSTLKLTGFDPQIGFSHESRTSERLDADTGASIPAWSARFE